MTATAIFAIIMAALSAMTAFIGGGIFWYASGIEPSYIVTKFSGIRLFLMNYSERFIPLLTVIGCFLCAYNLIKLAVEITDDERAGGFGSIQVQEIIRPVILLLCISLSPFIIKATDAVCRTFVFTTESVIYAKDSHNLSEDNNVQFADNQYNMVHDNYAELVKNDESGTKKISRFEEQYQAAQSFKETDKSRYVSVVTGIISDINDETSKKLNNGKGGSIVMAALSGLLNLLAKVLWVVYRLLYFILSQIYLCIMALFFPFVLCFSIITPFRDNLKNFFPRYLNIWFWQVIITIIICLYDVIEKVLVSGVDVGVGGLLALIVTLAFINIIKKTPELTSLIISAVSPSPAMPGAGHEAEIVAAAGTSVIKGGANQAASQLGTLSQGMGAKASSGKS